MLEICHLIHFESDWQKQLSIHVFYFNKKPSSWVNTSMPTLNTLVIRRGWDGSQRQRILVFRFRLIFRVPFARLLNSFDVICINQCLVIKNEAFDECIFFYDLYSTSFESFGTSLALTHSYRKHSPTCVESLHKRCWDSLLSFQSQHDDFQALFL